MNTFNINRVGQLLSYDWMLHKRTLTLAAILIPLIYIVIAFLTFISNTELNLESPNTGMPLIMTMACSSFFSFAQTAGIIVITTLLTEKFCYPRTATSYLTLPGTSAEKFVTMLAEYFFGWVFIYAAYIVMHYVTMGIGYLFAPELDWGVNIFKLMALAPKIGMWDGDLTSITQNLDKIEGLESSEPFVNSFASYVRAAIWMTPFVGIMEVAFYMILNMLFKTNVQIKAIACCVILWVALIFATIIGSCTYFGMHRSDEVTPDIIMNFATTIVTGTRYFMYTTPALACGFLYIFYKQVCGKQAK